MNVLLVRSVQRLLPRRSTPGDGGTTGVAAERAAAALVVASALIVLIVTVGGCLGLLGSRLAMLGIIAVGWILVELGTSRAPRDQGPQFSGPLSRPGGDRAIWIAAAAVAAAWVVLLCERLTMPPVAWDALTYHLRFPALWLQTGHLTTAAAPEGDPSNTYYPLAGEMLLYWGILSTGTDLWSSLSQVPFALAGAGALVSLARNCGAGSRLAVVAGLCWLATPGVVRQGVEAMVDVEQAGLVLCLLLFAVRWRGGGGRSWFLLAAAALGLLIGLKYSGLVYATAAAPFLFWAARGARRWGPAQRVGAGGWVAGLAITSVLGGYAYARNFLAIGNPLLPLEIRIGGAVLLHGPAAATYYFGPQSPRLDLPTFLASVRSVLEMGPLFLPLLLALPAAVVLGFRRGTDRGAFLGRLAVVGLLALLLGGAFLPYREHRYFYAVVALGWCVAAGLVERFPGERRAPWLAALLLVAQLPVTLFYWGKDVVIAGAAAGHLLALLAMASAAFILLVPHVRRRTVSAISHAAVAARARPWHAVLAAGAFVPVLALSGALYEPQKYDLWFRYWSTRHEWERLSAAREDLRDMASSWRYLAEADSGDTLAVAYVGMNAPYPLMGHGLRHRVLFVPRNRNQSASLYDWGSPPLDPLSGGNARDWRRNLERWGVGYLCVYRHMPGLEPEGSYPIEREWADADPARFRVIWDAPWARIYRLESHAARASSPGGAERE